MNTTNFAKKFYREIIAFSSFFIFLIGGYTEGVFLSNFEIEFTHYADISDYTRVALKNFLKVIIFMLRLASSVLLASIATLLILLVSVFCISAFFSSINRTNFERELRSLFSSIIEVFNWRHLVACLYSLSPLIFIAIVGAAITLVYYTKQISANHIQTCAHATVKGEICDSVTTVPLGWNWFDEYPRITVHMSGTRSTQSPPDNSEPGVLSDGTIRKLIRLGKAGGNAFFYSIDHAGPIIIPQNMIMSLVHWDEKTKIERTSAEKAPSASGDLTDFKETVLDVMKQRVQVSVSAQELLELDLTTLKGKVEDWENSSGEGTLNSVAGTLDDLIDVVKGLKESQEELKLSVDRSFYVAIGRPVECGETPPLSKIFFDTASPRTLYETQPALKAKSLNEAIDAFLKELLKVDPQHESKLIALVGFADFTGNRSKNFELAYRRAKYVSDRLLWAAKAQGIVLDSDKISLDGNGEIFSKPLASDGDEDLRARRVDLYICDLPPDTET